MLPLFSFFLGIYLPSSLANIHIFPLHLAAAKIHPLRLWSLCANTPLVKHPLFPLPCLPVSAPLSLSQGDLNHIRRPSAPKRRAGLHNSPSSTKPQPHSTLVPLTHRPTTFDIIHVRLGHGSVGAFLSAAFCASVRISKTRSSMALKSARCKPVFELRRLDRAF